jgi:hypothetical protein
MAVAFDVVTSKGTQIYSDIFDGNENNILPAANVFVLFFQFTGDN